MHYVIHTVHSNTYTHVYVYRFGCYTDDSQMTLALAQSLVDAGKVHRTLKRSATAVGFV